MGNPPRADDPQVPLTGLGDGIELCFPVAFRSAPRAFNPAILLQADEGRIQRSLVEIQVVPRHLLQPRGDLVCVLRSHGRQGPQNDEVQRSLQKLERFLLFTRHPSNLPERQNDTLLLGCQVKADSNWPVGEDRKRLQARSSHNGDRRRLQAPEPRAPINSGLQARSSHNGGSRRLQAPEPRASISRGLQARAGRSGIYP
jgi:hypothetical protein